MPRNIDKIRYGKSHVYFKQSVSIYDRGKFSLGCLPSGFIIRLFSISISPDYFIMIIF